VAYFMCEELEAAHALDAIEAADATAVTAAQ
jgi:hypothetical protein